MIGRLRGQGGARRSPAGPGASEGAAAAGSSRSAWTAANSQSPARAESAALLAQPPSAMPAALGHFRFRLSPFWRSLFPPVSVAPPRPAGWLRTGGCFSLPWGRGAPRAPPLRVASLRSPGVQRRPQPRGVFLARPPPARWPEARPSCSTALGFRLPKPGPVSRWPELSSLLPGGGGEGVGETGWEDWEREPLGWCGLLPEFSPWTAAAPLYPLTVKCQSLSHVRLSATPWTVPRQGPLSMGFSWQEYWSGLPSSPPGNLHNPGTEPRSLKFPAWVRRFLYQLVPPYM